jgi:hypothetical protein
VSHPVRLHLARYDAGMDRSTWLIRCAAELERLYLVGPRSGLEDVPAPGWGAETAAELAGTQRYRELEPVAAARAFWRDNE